MKYFFLTIVFLFSFISFSQNKIKPDVKQISVADTVFFTVDNSGCFLAYIRTYKLCKQKSGGRKVIFKTDTGLVIKKITAKNYNQFISNYKVSVNHFNADNLKGICTSTSEFELSDKKRSSKFKNTTCEVEFNPEMLLLQFIK